MDKDPAEATSLEGGFSIAEIPGKMKQFYDEAKKYSPTVKAVLRSKNMERFGPKTTETAKKIAEYMEMVGLGHCKDVGVALHGRGLKGSLEEIAKVAKKVYDFLKENKIPIHAILELPALDAASKGFSKKVSDVLTMVGLGHMKDGEEYSDEEMEGGGRRKKDSLDQPFEHQGLLDVATGGLDLEKIIEDVKKKIERGYTDADIRSILAPASDMTAKTIESIIKSAKKRSGRGIKLSPAVLDPLGVGKKVRKSIKKTDAQMKEFMGMGNMAQHNATMASHAQAENDKMTRQNKIIQEGFFGRKVGNGKDYMSGSAIKLSPAVLKSLGKKSLAHPAMNGMPAMTDAQMKKLLGKGMAEVYSDPHANHDQGKNMGSGKGKKAPSARNLIVKKVMREKGLSLPQASKYVKEHGLY
jgi:hypothetical protein